MNTLQVDPAASWWVHSGAAALLFAHVAGGAIGLVSGGASFVFAKGSSRHMTAGRWFIVSMLVMAAVGALVAPFLRSASGEPKLFDSAAALFTGYLVVTGWAAVALKSGANLWLEKLAFLFAATLAALLGGIGMFARDGTFAGRSGTSYLVFAAVVALAAVGDLRAILRGRQVGPRRLARHL